MISTNYEVPPLWSLLHSPFSSVLDTNIRLRILFSNTLSLHSSLNVRDHVLLSFKGPEDLQGPTAYSVLRGHVFILHK